MISALLFLNSKGDVLINRYYRDNINRHVVDQFRSSVIQQKVMFNLSTTATQTPIVLIDGVTFIYVHIGDIYVVAVTAYNINVTLALQLIYKLIDVFCAYFGTPQLDELTIRSNFVLIYELLDECVDYGWPQITAINLLQSYIKVAAVKDMLLGNERYSTNNNNNTHVSTVSSQKVNLANSTMNVGSIDSGITSEITGHVDWRQSGKFKYRSNEVFIDILENINLLMNSNGTVLSSDVSGKIVMKTYLSGMPECKFGLNDKLTMETERSKKLRGMSAASAASGTGAAAPVSNSNSIVLDDLTFHRCVKLTSFDIDRTISFVPPDGEFDLLSYRITDNIALPLKLTVTVTEFGRNRVEYEVRVKCMFSSKLFAQHIVIYLPVPLNTASTKFDVLSAGKIKYNSSSKCMVWKISKLMGNSSAVGAGDEAVCKGSVLLLKGISDVVWSRPPVTVTFTIPMHTCSALQVRFLKVFERSNYEVVKWVRYMTKNGAYQIRI